jgi:Transposase zinc-binding domain
LKVNLFPLDGAGFTKPAPAPIQKLNQRSEMTGQYCQGRSGSRSGTHLHRTKPRWITWQHLTVLRAITRCRTAALGGHLDECIDCGYRPAISYNSCLMGSFF